MTSPTVVRTRGVVLSGPRGFVIDVEAATGAGVPGLHLVGLDDWRTSEVRDRVRAAMINSGACWPQRHVTVALFPASLPKRGSSLDLAIAIAVLGICEEVPEPPEDWVFLGELGLDGRIRPVRGVLPAVQAAAADGYTHVVVPEDNAAEAAAAEAVTVLAAADLAQVLTWLRGTNRPAPVPSPWGAELEGEHASRPVGVDLADLTVPPAARRAVEVAAAGRHHISVTAPSEADPTALVCALPDLLPNLDRQQVLEVAAMHSLAGMVNPLTPVTYRPPVQTPPCGISRAGLIGGGGTAMRPGMVTLAHHGVLVLSDAGEFSASTLDALRQPLEEQQVTLAHGNRVVSYPARFLLALTIRPCPCGLPDSDCECTPAQAYRYRGRLAGPLAQRIGVHLTLTLPSAEQLHQYAADAEPTAAVAERVAAARERTRHRLRTTIWRTNSDIPHRELVRRFLPDASAADVLNAAIGNGQLTEISAARVVRVAWTLADLGGCDRPSVDQLGEAMELSSPPYAQRR